MAERRSLLEGVKAQTPVTKPEIEKQFVYGEAREKVSLPRLEPVAGVARSPLSTRIRSDYAATLKRASLERQLQGVEPNALCDILEAAIEPWLKSNGYLT